jgi:hypothetical protein
MSALFSGFAGLGLSVSIGDRSGGQSVASPDAAKTAVSAQASADTELKDASSMKTAAAGQLGDEVPRKA